ncbi:MAG TPA: cupin domain-containing protein [Ktedonobacteraceae bacterium]|jgi:putative monooxygenase|nr:cupin domain-containing protein [Ktedonobacteraceae bacterium]
MVASIHRSEVAPLKQNRGGQLYTLLSPKNTGNTAGYLGILTLAPGEVFLKHYHPYSEECFYVIQGELTIEGDESPRTVTAGTAVFVPKYEPHRLRNNGQEEVALVFFCSPLAPSPQEGHVMLEEAEPALS